MECYPLPECIASRTVAKQLQWKLVIYKCKLHCPIAYLFLLLSIVPVVTATKVLSHSNLFVKNAKFTGILPKFLFGNILDRTI